jgi:flavin reductase (DIM6/NTAB) family NADH-FMN oxidoreductase RutF
MKLTKEDIHRLDRITRLNIINSVVGIKAANLVGTLSEKGIPNLSMISSVVHLGSMPALLGFISRPARDVQRHTYSNILATRFYTINHVGRAFVENAHYTSAKFPEGVSEFEKCRLTEEYLLEFPAPYVKESKVKLGMKMLEIIPIKLNDTSLVIGEVQQVFAPDDAIDKDGHLDISLTENVGVSGLNTYYELGRIARYPYARPEELPDL